MKRSIAWILIALALGAFSGCVLPGTATVHLENNTTSETFTRVEFIAVSGGEDNSFAVSMAPDDGHSFLGIQPGTYDIRVTLGSGGIFTAFDNELVEKGVWHYRQIDDGDLPS